MGNLKGTTQKNQQFRGEATPAVHQAGAIGSVRGALKPEGPVGTGAAEHMQTAPPKSGKASGYPRDVPTKPHSLPMPINLRRAVLKDGVHPSDGIKTPLPKHQGPMRAHPRQHSTTFAKRPVKP